MMIQNFDPQTNQLRGPGKTAPIDRPKQADPKTAKPVGLSPEYWAAFVLASDWR
jgi:hypothetical protein